MDNVPDELQFMVLERTHPGALFSAHEVNKKWEAYILENDSRLRDEQLSEEIIEVLKVKGREAMKDPKKLDALSKELKKTKPKLVKGLFNLVKKAADNCKGYTEKVMNETLEPLLQAQDFTTAYNIIGIIADDTCKRVKRYMTTISRLEQEKIEEKVTDMTTKPKIIGISSVQSKANFLINTEYGIEDASSKKFIEEIVELVKKSLVILFGIMNEAHSTNKSIIDLMVASGYIGEDRIVSKQTKDKL